MPTAPDLTQDDSVGALVHRAIDDARPLAQAEIALVKAKAGERLGVWKAAAICFAIAGVLALAALIALLVGLIISFATLIGPWLATALVVGVVLLIALVLALVGKSRLS